MAHFRGTVCGDKSNSTDASRLGHKRLRTAAHGWDAGVTVELYINADGVDCADIWLNGGSNDKGSRVMLHNGPIDENARAGILARGR